MSIASVQTALDTRLQDLTGLPPVQLENTRNNGVTGQPFTRATLIPAQTSQMTVGVTGRDQLIGLYQIDVFISGDIGVGPANTLADQLVGHFYRGLSLTQAGVTTHIRKAWRGAGYRVEKFYMVPVSVQWYAIV